MVYVYIVWILSSLQIISAQDPLQGFLRQGDACFDSVKPPQCRRPLSRSFRSRYLNATTDEPATLVFLFTPKSPDVAEPLHECGGRLPPGTTYDPDADTEIFIHGWLDGVCRSAWMRECKEQLFLRARTRNTSYNVILVDWTWGNTPDYPLAGINSRIVGEQIGFVVQNIRRQTGVGPEKFHIIGHSLGAVAGGFIGRMNRGLRRITALDPAFAPFAYSPPNQRITYRDARIVDVIHSNGVDCFAVGIGDSRQLGHADFYPNGGRFQTSCIYYGFEAILKKDYFFALATLVPQLCSHIQSIQFYRLSINPNDCQYVGIAGRSYEEFRNQSSSTYGTVWAPMGMDYELYHRNDGKRRKYFLTTTNICPYYDDSYIKEKEFPFNSGCSA